MSTRIDKKKSKSILSKNNIEKKLKLVEDEKNELINDLKKLSDVANQVESEMLGTKSSLKNAQIKYRNVTSQNADMKSNIESLEYEVFTLDELKSRLIEELSEKEISEIKFRDVENKHKDLAKEILKLKITLNEKNVDFSTLELALLEAHNSVTKVKNTLSFRLGHNLIFGFKTWKGFFSLPRKLLALRADAKGRRDDKNSAAEIVSEKLSLPIFGSDREAFQLDEKQGDKLSDILKGLRVAAVMDKFTFNSFSPECVLFGLTPQNWKKELEAFKPDIVFIESAWRGKLDLWGAKVGHMSQELVDIAAWCHEHKIPSLFWNKEDPVHFETFLNSARLFDYIFTTDIDCVARYKTALQHDNVYFLPFAAQPKSNNPIEKYKRKDAFCFAGAYYKKYPERTKDLGNFVLSLPEFKPLEIYDRNYGKTDSQYKFPQEYQPFIVGTLPFEEIDKAYKGYNYAINLNSIKQSQSMFARRVFELLASNTVTVSNFSKGLRNIFGDLVFTSDSGFKITKDLERLSQSPAEMKKFRLLALRKVMSEHTYQDRLAYIYSKLAGIEKQQILPTVCVFSYVKSQIDFDIIYEHYQRQAYAYKKLLIVYPEGVSINIEDSNVLMVQLKGELGKLLGVDENDWVATFVKEDFYDKHYVEDLILATRYTTSDVIGKGSYYDFRESGLEYKDNSNSYTSVPELIARSSMIKASLFSEMSILEYIRKIYTHRFTGDCFSIDEFSYCMNGQGYNKASEITEITETIDQGYHLSQLSELAENKRASIEGDKEIKIISAHTLFEMIPTPKNTLVSTSRKGGAVSVSSTLADGKHEYWYANKLISPADLGAKDQALDLFLECDVGLNIQFVLFFMGEDGQRISHVVKPSNKNNRIEMPVGTVNLKFGLRIYASGSAAVKNLYLEHKPAEPLDILKKSETLLITNNYPSYQDLYKNAFVHSRVLGYKKSGQPVDVWRFKAEQEVSFHEFEGIDVTTGGAEYLAYVLKENQYKHILIHFLDDSIWQVVKPHIDTTRITVWLHGADIQSYERRAFLYETDSEVNKAKEIGDVKQAFWKSVLIPFHENLHLVFVSNYLADTAMEDLGIELDSSQYSVIPNPINTVQFNYIEKPVEQRKKILSIRPYASKVYANDLAVNAVLELAKEPFFNELEFRFIGDGVLFDETLEPLRQFDNVIIERKFVTHAEIADLHKEYGIFLCPSRMDTQGVSRDEAMSSGLVPITNAVAAIPEFVDNDSGVLCDGEDYMAIAAGIKMVCQSDEVFRSISSNAAKKVRANTCHEVTSKKEYEVIFSL